MTHKGRTQLGSPSDGNHQAGRRNLLGVNRSRRVGLGFLVLLVISVAVLGQELQRGRWHRAFARNGTLSADHFWSLQVPAGKIRVQIVADRPIVATVVSFTD